jgi:hypothetical protein
MEFLFLLLFWVPWIIIGTVSWLARKDEPWGGF